MANNPYVNKVIYGNDTVMDISDTTATESDVLAGKEFYKANGAKASGTAVMPDISNCYQSTDTISADIDDADYVPFYDSSATAKKNSLWSNIKSLIANAFQPTGTKNLIICSRDSAQLNNTNSNGTWSNNYYTLYGINFIISNNGTLRTMDSLVIQGTATADATFYMKANLEAGDYILSGCSSPASSSTFYLSIPYLSVTNYSGDTPFTVSSRGVYTVELVVKSGYSSSSYLNVYPMIRPATYKNNTFVSPVFSNAVLTRKIPSWAARAYNYSGTITFTNVYDDGDFAYKVYFYTDSNTVNKSPYAKLTGISGSATSRTLTYETDADNGKLGYLLRIPVDY